MTWKPGESGNPSGANTDELSFWRMVKRASKQEDHKRVRMAAEKFLDLCAGGEQWAQKELFDRGDGKPSQTTVHEGNPDKPVAIAEIIRKVIE